MKKQITCRCDAYRFPHREFGGKCKGMPLECTCHPFSYRPSPNCPEHGRDWDEVRQRLIDDRLTGDRP